MPENQKNKASQVMIMHEKDYATITCIQNNQSQILSDIGKKEIFLVKDEQIDWKIIREVWSAEGIDEHLK